MTEQGGIFFHQHAEDLLKNKTVIVMGDSIHRSIYKDLVCLFKEQNDQNSRYLFEFELRAKGEKSFLGDSCLIKSEKASNGTDYREVREFKCGGTVFRFYFITRVFSEYMESVLNELKTLSPHVIIMNSTFWDIHKYKNGMEEFKSNLEKLLSRVKNDLPKHVVFIWNAAPPLDENCKGGFFNPGTTTLPREDIIEANNFAKQKVSNWGHYFNDLFSALTRHQLFRQAGDGIHWDYRAHRKMSNMILGKICLAWKKPVPEPPQHRQLLVEDDSGGLWEDSPYGRNNYYPEAYYPDDEDWGYDNEGGYFLEPAPPRRPQYPLSRYEEPYPQGDMEDYDDFYYPSPSPTPLPRPRSFPEYDHPHHHQGFDGNRSLPDFRNHDYYNQGFGGFDGNRSLPIQNGSPFWPRNRNSPTPPGPHRASNLFSFTQPFGSPELSFQLLNHLNASFSQPLMGPSPWPSPQNVPVFSAPQQGTEDGYKARFKRFSRGSQNRSRGRKHPYRKNASHGVGERSSLASTPQSTTVGKEATEVKDKTESSSAVPAKTSSTSLVNGKTDSVDEQNVPNSSAGKVEGDGVKSFVTCEGDKMSSGCSAAVATKPVSSGVDSVLVTTTTDEKCDTNNNLNKAPGSPAAAVAEESSDVKTKVVPIRKRKRGSEDLEASSDVKQPSKFLRVD